MLRCASRLDKVDTGEPKEEISRSLMGKGFFLFVETVAFEMDK